MAKAVSAFVSGFMDGMNIPMRKKRVGNSKPNDTEPIAGDDTALGGEYEASWKEATSELEPGDASNTD